MAIFFQGIANVQSSNGYVVGGAGSYNSKLISQAAIGGEKVFGKGIGAGGANIGFGLHYWSLRHLGVRAEFRDIVFPAMSPATVWAFRGGIAFR